MATFSLATLRRGADLTPAVGVGGWYWPLAAARALGIAGLDTDVKSLFADWRDQFPRLQLFADECARGGAPKFKKLMAYRHYRRNHYCETLCSTCAFDSSKALRMYPRHRSTSRMDFRFRWNGGHVPPITFVPTQLMHFSCYEKTAEVPLSSPTALYANIGRRGKTVDLAGYAFLSGRRCK
jgi:hypothetical protein